MAFQKTDSNAQVDERAPLLAPEGSAGVPGKDDEDVSAIVIWMVFPILLAGIFLSNVVSSVVIATNQHIASEFDALSSAAWLLTAYTLAQSASQPLYGKVSDIYGRRKCLVFCWTVFGLGCLLVGVGQTYWQIILGRAISGIGSAGKIALTSIVVADLVPLRHVAQYRAYVNLTATTARSIGGPIGGWLSGSVGWRWCFLVQFPVALIGLGLVLWKLPEPSQFQSQQLEEDGKKVSNLSRIDFAGAITLVGTILTGLISLDMATKGASVLITSSLGVVFITFLVLFVLTEKYYADEPILPLDLVLKRDVLTSYLIVGFQSAGQFGLLYTIPIYFQVVGRESISSTGTRIVPVVIGNAVGTVLSGKLITKFKKYKHLTIFGNLTGLFGFLLVLLSWRGNTNWFQALFVSLPGVGMGIIQSSTFIHLAASLDHSQIAIAGTTWFLAQNIGVLVGASFSTTVINHALQSCLQTSLSGLENKDDVS
ncbi:major facilitator superfamily domain-containing protein [Ilyonectria sp. MPI-CAGE-AT-0026]|nr:major facilitator superfamily domain-containing protein [Ilyonectria sp. MPI-CAGE-AT-0026]